MRRRLLLIFIFGAFQLLSWSQDTENPFDLKHRDRPNINAVDPEEKNPFDLEGKTIENTPAPINNSSNPFDLKRIAPTDHSTKIPKTTEAVAPKKTTSSNQSPINSKNKNFLFWVILSMMVLVTLLATLFKSQLNGIYRAFLNDNMLKLKIREQAGVIGLPYLLLYLFFFFSASVFCYLLLQSRGVNLSSNIKLLGYCFAAITGIFVIKHFVLSFLSYVFPISKSINQYNFTIIVFSIVLGIFLVPFNLVIAYGPENLSSSLIFGAILVIILTYMFRAVRSLFIASSYVAFHKFHFFMYLCTVEIAPVLILVKIFFSQTGIQ